MIKSLKARGLNRTLNFDLTFHEDINIITGRNGSGKTTVLKLLWYAISGNLERIAQEITFDSFEIVTDKVRVAMGTRASGKQTLRTLTYRIGDIEVPMTTWPVAGNPLPEYIREINRQIARESGASIFFPTFRRIEGGFSISSGGLDDGARFQNTGLYSLTWTTAGTGFGGLQQAMKELSERVSVGAHRLVASTSTDDIDRLLTSQYVHLSEMNNHLHMDLSKFILERVGGGSRNGAGANAAEPLTTEETLEEIQQRVRNVTQQSDALLRPFTVLSKLVSQIFENKGITVGRAVTLGDARDAIMSDVLSSGEKQMLSFLCYNAFASDTCLFIDEPEISLHVDWQRVLFPILLQQSTGNQFIVATHSPFIYSKYADKELVLAPNRGDQDADPPHERDGDHRIPQKDQLADLARRG
jgi:predicted ATPase